MQGLPLSWFDSRNRGDVMSYFTNDVDTISDALNNSFALVIQSFIPVSYTHLDVYKRQAMASYPLCSELLFPLYSITFQGPLSRGLYIFAGADIIIDASIIDMSI